MRHTIQMLAGCLLPLLLLFMLPLFGVSGGTTLFIAIVALFAGHLWMLGDHGHYGSSGIEQRHENPGSNNFRTRNNGANPRTTRGVSHEHHQR